MDPALRRDDVVGSEGARFFAEAIHGPATQIVPAYVARLLNR